MAAVRARSFAARILLWAASLLRWGSQWTVAAARRIELLAAKLDPRYGSGAPTLGGRSPGGGAPPARTGNWPPPSPPEHWLRKVRGHAPQLLRDRGLVDVGRAPAQNASLSGTPAGATSVVPAGGTRPTGAGTEDPRRTVVRDAAILTSGGPTGRRPRWMRPPWSGTRRPRSTPTSAGLPGGRGDSASDGSPLDDSTRDGAARDGSTREWSAQGSAAPGAAARDEPVPDGSARNGSTWDGSIPSGSTRDGSVRGGSVRDGSVRGESMRSGSGRPARAGSAQAGSAPAGSTEEVAWGGPGPVSVRDGLRPDHQFPAHGRMVGPRSTDRRTDAPPGAPVRPFWPSPPDRDADPGSRDWGPHSGAGDRDGAPEPAARQTQALWPRLPGEGGGDALDRVAVAAMTIGRTQRAGPAENGGGRRWPPLPDDAALWTVEQDSIAVDDHVDRLEREQRGSRWNG
jgi:hypothetical protein